MISVDVIPNPNVGAITLDTLCERADALRCKLVVVGITPEIIRAGRKLYADANRSLKDYAEHFAPCARLDNFHQGEFVDASVSVQRCIINARRAAKDWEAL